MIAIGKEQVNFYDFGGRWRTGVYRFQEGTAAVLGVLTGVDLGLRGNPNALIDAEIIAAGALLLNHFLCGGNDIVRRKNELRVMEAGEI